MLFVVEFARAQLASPALIRQLDSIEKDDQCYRSAAAQQAAAAAGTEAADI